MAVKGFVYRGKDRTVEDVKRAATMSTGNYDSIFQDGIPTFKVKEGENIIRIMPPTWNDKEVKTWGKDWAIIISVHNNIGVDKGSFLCLDAMRGEPCPICEIRRGATDDEERFALSPNKRALAWVIDRNDEGAGPELWSMPIKKIFKVINARSVDRKSGALVLIDDPEEGFDVIFNCDGAGKKTADYTGVEVDRDPTPLNDNEKVQDRWMKYILESPLPDVLNWPEPDYMEKVLSGRVSRKDEAEEAEEVEGSLNGGARRRRPAVEEGDPEPRSSRRRPVADPPEEEEGEPAPRTTARRGRAAEPAEEDETPPEEEADPPPRASRRRAEPVEEEAEPAPRRTTRRAPPADEPAEDEPAPRRTARRNEPAEEDAPAPSRQARGSLERLRPGARR